MNNILEFTKKKKKNYYNNHKSVVIKYDGRAVARKYYSVIIF